MDASAIAPSEAGFHEDDPVILAEFQKTIMIQTWLNNIPSSASEVSAVMSASEPTDTVQADGSGSGRTHNVSNDVSDDYIKARFLENTPLKFTSKPSQIMTSSERESVLKYADERVRGINRKIASHPNYRGFTRTKGSAIWPPRRKQGPEEKGFWSPHRLLAWVRTISIFRWFSKKGDLDSQSQEDVSDNNRGSNADAARITPKQPEVFVPYSSIHGTAAFGGDAIQDDIHAAVTAISIKLDDLPDPPPDQMPIDGFPDCQNLVHKQVEVDLLETAETPSIQEIHRLTTLLQEKQNSSRMKSIFGIREFIRTDTHPSLVVLQREPSNPSVMRRVFDRLGSIFWSRSFRRRPVRRRLRMSSRNHFNDHEVNRQEVIMNDLLNQLSQPADALAPRYSTATAISQITSGFRGLVSLMGFGGGRVFPEMQEQSPSFPFSASSQVQRGESGSTNPNRRRADEMPNAIRHNGLGTIEIATPRQNNPLRRRMLSDCPWTVETLNQSENETRDGNGSDVLVEGTSPTDDAEKQRSTIQE